MGARKCHVLLKLTVIIVFLYIKSYLHTESDNINHYINALFTPGLYLWGLYLCIDIFTTAKLKFYYKYIHNDLPTRLLSFQFIPLNELNDYNTSQCDKLFINRVNKVIAKQSLIFDIPIVVNQTDSNIIEKIHTHSLQGFTFYIKNNFLNNYQYSCNRNNCYVCQNNQ